MIIGYIMRSRMRSTSTFRAQLDGILARDISFAPLIKDVDPGLRPGLGMGIGRVITCGLCFGRKNWAGGS